MQLQTISQVSKLLNVSTRTLRYYEQVGLIRSAPRENSAYRSYDEDAVLRLRQIIILRKLRVPLKQIGEILDGGSVSAAIDVFQQNLAELEEEISSLSKIKEIVQRFIERLHLENARLDLLEDDTLIEVVDALSVPRDALKEKKSLAELNDASRKLERLTDSDVRILYVPPMTVASCHHMGENPEDHSIGAITRFALENDLAARKPDLRMFGFNNPIHTGAVGTSGNGYEAWISIPEDMDVPDPLRKIHFHGGLYAAHAIKMGDFHHWPLLHEWVQRSEKYENDWGAIRCTPNAPGMDWCFEEELNFITSLCDPHYDHNAAQLDLLLPIRPR